MRELEVDRCMLCPWLDHTVGPFCALHSDKRDLDRDSVEEGEWPPDWCPLRADGPRVLTLRVGVEPKDMWPPAE